MEKIIFAVLLLFCFHLTIAQEDNTKHVNVFIGTGGDGHNFPGATRPGGMVQLSPDNRNTGWDYCSGYNYKDSVILGFSHTHLSGTGGADLADILVMPYSGNNPFSDNNYAFRSSFSHDQEKAFAGYYSVFLKGPKVNAELTASHRVGMHRYTFPENKKSQIIIDLFHHIEDGCNPGSILESQLEVENDSIISGYRIISGFATLRKVFFVAKFSKPFIKTTMAESIMDPKRKACHDFDRVLDGYKFFRSPNAVKGAFDFETKTNEQILMKVAISMVNIENARNSLEEIPDWNFDKVVSDAKNEWGKVLGKVKVEGSQTQKQIFYTAMYHAFIFPNQVADSDGRYRGPDYEIHNSPNKKFYTTFSLWDTFRALHPLYTILDPIKTGDIVNSMIEYYQNNKYLPIWSLWGTENHCMIGNPAVPVISDAYLKNIQGFDKKKAYEAIIGSLTKDHQESPFEGLKYAQMGYLPYDKFRESVSTTLEMSFEDGIAALVAKAEGKNGDFEFLASRAKNYKNLFHPKLNLMAPKDNKGQWKPNFDPTKSGAESEITEANSWQYSWSVMHDILGLIALFPSKERFVQKLDSVFDSKNKLVTNDGNVTGLIGQYAHGNEPSHHIPYIYSAIGLPWKTQKLVRTIVDSMYNNTPDGITGNEDVGQMSAWYIFSSIGFYPMNPVGGIYQIGTPTFPKAILKVADGLEFTVLANNTSAKNRYIQSALLNGKPYSKAYLLHSDIVKGGILEFKMGNKPNLKWGLEK